MQKLLAAYAKRPSFKTALAVATYAKLHPTAETMLTAAETELLAKAKAASSLGGRLEIMVVR